MKGKLHLILWTNKKILKSQKYHLEVMQLRDQLLNKKNKYHLKIL